MIPNELHEPPDMKLILQMTANGCPAEMIAEALRLTTRAIKSRKRNIREFLGADTFTHAVVIGIRRRIIN